MDLFASVLVTITILTICGICLFIFICSLHPKIVLSYLRRKKHRTYYITASKRLSQIDNDLHINNRDSIIRTSVISVNHDKRTYLRAIERSVRTGRRIEYEKENNSFGSLRQYITKRLSSTTDIQSSTQI